MLISLTTIRKPSCVIVTSANKQFECVVDKRKNIPSPTSSTIFASRVRQNPQGSYHYQSVTRNTFVFYYNYNKSISSTYSWNNKKWTQVSKQLFFRNCFLIFQKVCWFDVNRTFVLLKLLDTFFKKNSI